MVLNGCALDILVVGGQSNSAGHGIGEVTEEYIPDERILWMTDNAHPRFEEDGFHIDYPAETQITVAEEPVEDGQKKGKFAFSFAREYISAGLLAPGRRILIIHAGVGGTGFCRGEWGIGSILYRRLCDMVAEALGMNSDNRLVAFLWHQGECDAFENADMPSEEKQARHRAALGGMLADFERRFVCPSLPFVTGSFADEWYFKNKVQCDAVLEAIRAVTAARGGAFVDTAGLKSNNQSTGNGDDIHFSRESLHLLGARMFDAYQTILNKNK